VFDYLGVIAGAVVAALFCWLGIRAWRSKRRLVKWIGTPLAGFFTLVFAAMLVAAFVGYWKLNRQYDNPPSAIAVDMTVEQIARGEKFVFFCAGCHSPNKKPPLLGNDFLAEAGAPPVGRMYAPNLTPAHLAGWTDGEIIRAIREGIHKNGRSLLIMPSSQFRRFSDNDVAAIVAYLRSQPAVEPDTPRTRLNFLGAIMANIAPIFQAQAAITEPVIAPPASVTPEYGKYLASYGCTICHGQDLRGDVQFGVPTLMASGLAWSEEDFLSFFYSGLRPSGLAVDGDQMPWDDLRVLFADDDLRAIFLHLQEHFSSPENYK